MDPKIFREYDIRGVVGEDFTQEDAYSIGQGFASRIIDKGGKNLVVGYDGRTTSPALHAQLMTGAVSTGAHVQSIGLCSTPQLYFSSRFLDADAAIMITGSHNPPEYNGFKLMAFNAPYCSHDLKSLYYHIQQHDFHVGIGVRSDIQTQDAYAHHILRDYRENYQPRALKVAWDAGNGAVGPVLEQLVAQLSGDHLLLNIAVDGTFPNHHPDPTKLENMQQLREAVLQNKCDLGIGFDGDGDRVGVLDNEGNLLYGDELLEFFAEDVLGQHPGATVIADVKTSQAFFDRVSELGGEPLLWKTGHSLIKQKMREVNAPLAGEMSGHIFFGDRNFGFDDGLYSAIRLLGILGQRKGSLSEWRSKRPKLYTTPEIQVPCDQKFEAVTALQEYLKKEQIPFFDIDGVRCQRSYGWWLVRPSNTQEILVIRAEAQTPDDLNKLLKEIEISLSACHYPIPPLKKHEHEFI